VVPERLMKDFQNPNEGLNSFMATDVPVVIGQLSLFNDATKRLRSIVKSSMDQLFNQLIRPRLRTFIPDVFGGMTYVLTEESYSTNESSDLFFRRFVKAWEAQIEGYKKTLLELNYEHLFNLTLDALLRPWERQVLSMKYNELGAIRLDRDVRSVVTYLTSQTAFGKSREKFRRLQHISTLLNLDLDDDVDEFYSSSGVVWTLSIQEARSIVALRV